MAKFVAAHVPSSVASGNFAGWTGDVFTIPGRTSKKEQSISHEILVESACQICTSSFGKCDKGEWYLTFDIE